MGGLESDRTGHLSVRRIIQLSHCSTFSTYTTLFDDFQHSTSNIEHHVLIIARVIDLPL